MKAKTATAFLLLVSTAFSQTNRPAVRKHASVRQTQASDAAKWEPPSGNIWNVELEEATRFTPQGAPDVSGPTSTQPPQRVSRNSVLVDTILDRIPRPDPDMAPFLKYADLDLVQAKALATEITKRTGIAGGLQPISAINGIEGPPTASDKQVLMNLVQRTPDGSIKAFLVYVGGTYVNYKYLPVVTVFDTDGLPRLQEMHLVTSYGKDPGDPIQS